MDLQIKNKEVNKHIEHKEIGLIPVIDSISITPLTFTYPEKTTDIKDDFIFYLEKQNIVKVKTNISRFRNTEFFIIDYQLDDDIYELVFCPPITVVLC